MAVILTCIFAACDKTDSQNPDFKVTIHPNNGQSDIVWDITTDIPSITKYGYHIVGYYLDEDMTISTTLESLKASELTKNIDVYVKWEKDSVPPKTKIVTNNLLCDYDTRALSGKVSNSTSVFSFNDEISVEKGATYTVSTDINGINVIPSKTVNLEIGDNVFYILVSNDDELTLYTATVRRRPIYTVTFDTLGGTEVEAQQVEEDAFATAPTTEKIGCTFENWDWDFATPITENTTITAIWNAFVYNIVYDLNIPEDSASQEVDNSMNPTTYTVDDTIYFYTPRRNGYYFTGWSIGKIVKGTTGTITTTAQWRPIIYEIIYNFGDANSASKAANNDLNPRYYCVENEITFAEPTRAGYSFVSWDKNIEKGTTGTQTVTANWNVNQYNIEYVLNGWTNAENNKAIYTIEDKTFALFDGINGESLFCGWYLDDEYTNCIETIDASTMRDYTIYAMPDCGATKGLLIENGVVKSYLGISTNVIIPSYYKGDTVVGIGNSAFNNFTNLMSVTIPDQVISVGNSAFFGCSGLTKITGPSDAVSTVAKQCNRTAIEEIVITSGTSIGDSAFYGCSGLTSIIIPDSVTSIGDSAFLNCNGLMSVAIPNSVTSIGSLAFYGCDNLQNIYIANIVAWCNISGLDNLMRYGASDKNMYLSNELVTSVSIPNKVTTIPSYAFYGCDSIESITISDGVTSVGSSAFSSCNLTKITGPCDAVSTVAKQCDSNSVEEIVITSGTSIDDYAFCDCSGLTSIIIPDSVTSIGDSAFRGCDNLQNIYIADIVAWCNISGLDNLMRYGASDKNMYLSNELVTSVAISNEVTAIPSCAFYGCESIVSVTISDSVTSVGSLAFSGCNLTKITGPSDTVSTVVKQCNSTAFEIVITSGTSIGDSAFYDCTGLKSVTIPNSVTSIGNSAFFGCSGLISVTIPDSVTSIGSYAFNDCSSLTSVTISDSVASIGTLAFDGCTNLQNIYIADIAAWCNISGADWLMEHGSSNKNLYLNNELVTSVTIPVSVTSIGRSAFKGFSSLTSITISDSVTSVGNSAFSGCTGLTKITGPSDMVSTVAKQCDSKAFEVVITSGTSISNDAFRNCTGLTSITIPDNVTSIGDSAFRGCDNLQNIYIADIVAWCNISGLDNLMRYGASDKNLYLSNELVTSLTIPDEVTAVSSYAFYGCNLTKIIGPSDAVSVVAKQCNSTAVEEIVITSGTSIGDSAFSGCSGLISATISSSVTSIGEDAFYKCSKLTSITIPDSVTSIGSYAFRDCSSLTTVTWNAIDCATVGSSYQSIFSGCSSLTIVNIGEKVISIPSYVFGYCDGLTSITIPNSVTSIGASAFYGCSGLTSVSLGNGVVSIGDSAFYGCSGLTSVSLGNGVINIGDSAFFGCVKLTSITIPNGVTSIGNSAFLGCWRLIEVYNKSSLTIIADSNDNGYVASNAKNVYTDTEGESKLSTDNGYVVYTDGTEKIVVAYTGTETELTLPSYITQINDRAFYNCAELTSVIIPNSVISIGWYAFNSCSGLTSVTIGNGVTSIGYSAFFGCSGLTRIIVEKGNPKYHSVGNCLIETASKTLILGCKTSVIPSDGSVTSIESAFWGCSDLISITIPNSVTSIGYGAFYGCSGLTSINFEGTKAQWNAITKGDNWNDGVATDCTITCSDGTI